MEEEVQLKKQEAAIMMQKAALSLGLNDEEKADDAPDGVKDSAKPGKNSYQRKRENLEDTAKIQELIVSDSQNANDYV